MINEIIRRTQVLKNEQARNCSSLHHNELFIKTSYSS